VGAEEEEGKNESHAFRKGVTEEEEISYQKRKSSRKRGQVVPHSFASALNRQVKIDVATIMHT